MDFERILKSADGIKALSDENRLRILFELRNGERCVCEIWKRLELPQNLISHHLKVLKKAGLIKSRKVGLNVHYSINRNGAEKTIGLVDRLLSRPN